MMTKQMIIPFLLISSMMVYGQDWRRLEYNPHQPGLEHNPLKGFTSLWPANNGFPHSIKGHLFGLDEVMTGMDSFDWSVIDMAIAQDASQGRFSYIQVNIDPANGSTQMPEFLIDQVDWDIHPDDRVPDWNNETLMQAMLRFIAAYGQKYNGDPRVHLVHYGLYGMWGEWHVGEYKKYEMTSANQHRLSNAYQEAFPDKTLLARYPNLPDNQVVGFSDGLFFEQSISTDQPWFFHNQLKSAHADRNWKIHSIGGEISPDLQPEIWKSWPNAVGQDVVSCLDSIRPSWLISHHVLSMDSASNPVQWKNALRCQKMLGYTLFVNKYRLTAYEGNLTVELEIQNRGLAPIYADWVAAFGVLDSMGKMHLLGEDKLQINRIFPGSKDYYRAFTAHDSLEDGTYTVLMRIVNPLESLSELATPVRFANTSQDVDIAGWLSLGELNISDGSCGIPPERADELILSPDSVILSMGDQLELHAVVLPENADHKRISWLSDHPATASVDSTGLVTTGPLTGNAVIYAVSQDGGLKAQTVIQVEPNWYLIPGKIEAEAFINQSGVQTEQCRDVGGGKNVGWIDSNDWMEYPVFINTNATRFSATFRVSSPNNGGMMALYAGDTLLGEISVPYTGGWQNWRTVEMDIELSPGRHFIKLLALQGGFNLNYFEVSLGPTFTPYAGQFDPLSVYPVPASRHIMINSDAWPFNEVKIIDPGGKVVFTRKYRDQIHLNLELDLLPGIYILQVKGNDKTYREKQIIVH